LSADRNDERLDTALLRDVADRQQITELMYRYAAGVQQRDPEVVTACFSDDAVLEYGSAVVEGIDAVRQYFSDSMAALSSGAPLAALDETIISTPVMTNVLIDIDGDTAHAVHTCLAIHAGRAGEHGRVLVNGTRNTDELVRTPEGWRIQRREHATVWNFDVEGTVGGSH
jgi:ketosteroid isomerase-like protein